VLSGQGEDEEEVVVVMDGKTERVEQHVGVHQGHHSIITTSPFLLLLLLLLLLVVILLLLLVLLILLYK